MFELTCSWPDFQKSKVYYQLLSVPWAFHVHGIVFDCSEILWNWRKIIVLGAQWMDWSRAVWVFMEHDGPLLLSKANGSLPVWTTIQVLDSFCRGEIIFWTYQLSLESGRDVCSNSFIMIQIIILCFKKNKRRVGNCRNIQFWALKIIGRRDDELENEGMHCKTASKYYFSKTKPD